MLSSIDTALKLNRNDWLRPLVQHTGRFLCMTGSPFRAQALFAALFEIATQVNSLGLELVSRQGMALSFMLTGNYSEMQKSMSISLNIARTLNDAYYEAVSLNNLGTVQYIQGNYGKACDLHARAKVLFQHIGDNVGEASCLNNLGNAEYGLGNYAKARALYLQSLELNRALGNRWTEAISLLNVAYLDFGELNSTNAGDLIAQALALCSETGNRWSEARCFSICGHDQFTKGEFFKALELYKRSIILFTDIGDELGALYVSSGTSAVMGQHGKYPLCARIMYGTKACASKLEFNLELIENKLLDWANDRLEAAINFGSLDSDSLTFWQSEAELVNMEELTELTVLSIETTLRARTEEEDGE